MRSDAAGRNPGEFDGTWFFECGTLSWRRQKIGFGKRLRRSGGIWQYVDRNRKDEGAQGWHMHRFGRAENSHLFLTVLETGKSEV